MSHNLFNNHFFSRKPAWHRLGLVADEELSAIAAFKKTGGYKVELVPLVAYTDEAPIESPYRAIIRHPTDDDKEYRFFGEVASDYVLVSPEDACLLWDEYVAKPVETFGSLGQGISAGHTIFMSTELPVLNVKGDVIKNYLVFISPMDGKTAARVFLSSERPVCQNTIVYGESIASIVIRVKHDSQVKLRLGKGLEGIYSWATKQVELMDGRFNLLVNAKPQLPDVWDILNRTYKIRKPKKGMTELEVAVLEERNKVIQPRADAVFQFWVGTGGTGLDLPSCYTKDGSPNLWRLLQAGIEVEDYRRGRGERSIALDAVMGKRAETKARLFKEVMDFVRT